jgi:hypothetical protein
MSFGMVVRYVQYSTAVGYIPESEEPSIRIVKIMTPLAVAVIDRQGSIEIDKTGVSDVCHKTACHLSQFDDNAPISVGSIYCWQHLEPKFKLKLLSNSIAGSHSPQKTKYWSITPIYCRTFVWVILCDLLVHWATIPTWFHHAPTTTAVCGGDNRTMLNLLS